MARKAKIDPKRQVYTRPAARRTIKPKSREPERKSSSVDDYDVYTIQPKKPQGQSTQPGRVRDRGHRPSYDIHGQSEDTDDSDEEFVPFPSRAAPKTERIYPEKTSNPRQPPRHSYDDSRHSSSRDLSMEPPPRSARHDQPRRDQSNRRHRRVRDSSSDSSQSRSPPRRRAERSARVSSTDSSQSRSPPRRRAKSSARNNRDRSSSLDYHSKPQYREYLRPVRNPPDYGAGLPRSATFPSRHSQRHTTSADHDFGPSSRSQTFPNLNDQSYNTPFMDPMFPSSGGFQSFTTSYTSPNGHQSYTTNKFGGSSPFNQPFFSGGSAPRTPRNNTAFFTDRPRRTSQYDPFPQSSPNAHGPQWEGGFMDDLLRAGHEHIDRSIENAQRRMQQEKAREAREREREPRHEWGTGRNHNHHDHTPRYDHKHSDTKHSRDHAQDHNSNSSHHHNDYERFQRQRDRARSRARSQARNHNHEHHPRAPSPVKEDTSTTHDYYATLGIAPTATLEEVRAAAKKRRIATHPDKCKKPGMTEAQIREIDEEAKRVGEAAGCLSDKNERARYDYQHHTRKGFGGMRM